MPKIKKEIKISKEREQALEKMWKVATKETTPAKPVRKVKAKKQSKDLAAEIQQIQMQAAQAEPDFVVVPAPKNEIEHLPMSIAEEAQFRSEQKTEEDNGNSKFKFKFNFNLNEQLAKIPRVVFAVVAVVIMVVLATFGYTYRFNKQLVAEQEKAKNLQEVEKRIGIFMELPADEEPVFATVTDVEKIKEQKFFAKAQNGDIVLIYAKNKKALLYRWSTNKVIEFSNVAGSESDKTTPAPADATEATTTPAAEQETQPQPSSQAQPQTVVTPDASTPKTTQDEAETKTKVKVTVLNGTTQKGLAQKIASQVTQLAGTVIAKVGNAKGSFEKTVVVDLSGSNSDLAAEIANQIGGEVGQLPTSETAPSGDILVIAGKQ